MKRATTSSSPAPPEPLAPRVGQLAKLHGASRVIGSAGSAEKIALITSKYGYDAAFNYKDGKVSRQLAAAAPDGIDVYFDNVGGDHLEAAIFAMNAAVVRRSAGRSRATTRKSRRPDHATCGC